LYGRGEVGEEALMTLSSTHGNVFLIYFVLFAAMSTEIPHQPPASDVKCKIVGAT
jgi:hypothetical protein